MALKAVLFDFNGVIINDEAIHYSLIGELLLAENLRPEIPEYRELCVGRSDRACLRELFARRGRVLDDDYLDKLIAKKADAYLQRLETLAELPLYPGVRETISLFQEAGLVLGLVTGAIEPGVERVLERAGLNSVFSTIVTGEEIVVSKPNPQGYLLALDRLAAAYPNLQLSSGDCLAIEDTPAGIAAAKSARMQVLGVANTYPMHILQRQANWTVDFLSEIEIDRLQGVFSGEIKSKC